MDNNQLWVIALVALLAAGLWVWVSTSQADVYLNPLTLERDRAALSVAEQIELGAEMAPEFERELGGPVRDARQDRVARVGAELLQALGELERGTRARAGGNPNWTGFAYDFQLLESPQINAFALPGGPIYITAGLLQHLGSDDQLAAVLAHEVGHVLLRHTAKAFEARFKGDLLLWVLGTAVGEDLGYDVASGVNLLLQLGYSREQETQSDAFGYVLSCVSSFDPGAMLEVFALFQQLGSDAGIELLSTHPTSGRRIEELGGIRCRFPVPAF